MDPLLSFLLAADKGDRGGCEEGLELVKETASSIRTSPLREGAQILWLSTSPN